MGLFAGAVTCRRYRVVDPTPDAYLQPFTKSIARHAFRPLHPDKDDTASSGWVNPRNLLDTTFPTADWHLPPFIVLGFRIDKKALPARIFKARVDLAIREHIRVKRQARMNPDEKTEIERSIRAEMLRQIAPSTNVVDVAWNLETGRLLVGTTASSTNQMVLAAFAETFGLTPVPQVPFLMGEAWAHGAKKTREFGQLEPEPWGAMVRRKLRTAAAIAAEQEETPLKKRAKA